MDTELFRNNASSLLAVSIDAVETSIQVGSGLGALFPSPTATEFFRLAIEDTDGNIEYTLCTGRSSDLLTVIRGQEGSTARAYTAGDARVELRMTRETMERLVQVEAGEVNININFTGTVQLNGSVIWTAANDGPGSGLNADLLDGLNSSAFATAAHNHSASEVTSGTFVDARIAQSSVTQHQAALTILETQITDGALLARNAAAETIAGAWAFTARPKTTSKGGFLSHADAANVGGEVTVSTASPSGTPGEGDIWLKREA
jgi:hypothetical protein